MWKQALCLAVLLGLPGISMAMEPIQQEEIRPLEKIEEQEEESMAPREKPVFELHGEYRWLYGSGRVRGMAGPPASMAGWTRFDKKESLATRRLRLFPTIHVTDHLSVKTMLEDNRMDKGPEVGDFKTHHLYLSRASLDYVNHSFEAEAGRFNYFLMDGILLDQRVDGLRLQYKEDDSPTGRFTLFYGRTVGERPDEREGFIFENCRKEGKWLTHFAYLDLHATRRQQENLPLPLTRLGFSAGRSGTRYDRQRIGDLHVAYAPNEDFTFGLESIYAYGRHKSDGYGEHDTGYIASAIYKEADPRRPGSYDLWIQYYHLPSAALVAPTLDADTTAFQRMGFSGWGVYLDTVPVKGIIWTLEGFSLKNKRNGPFTKNFHEYVLGTSLTAYF